MCLVLENVHQVVERIIVLQSVFPTFNFDKETSSMLLQNHRFPLVFYSVHFLYFQNALLSNLNIVENEWLVENRKTVVSPFPQMFFLQRSLSYKVVCSNNNVTYSSRNTKIKCFEHAIFV